MCYEQVILFVWKLIVSALMILCSPMTGPYFDSSINWSSVVSGYNDSRIWFVPLSLSLSCIMQKKSAGKRAMQNFFLKFIYVNTQQTTSITLYLLVLKSAVSKMLPATLKSITLCFKEFEGKLCNSFVRKIAVVNQITGQITSWITLLKFSMDRQYLNTERSIIQWLSKRLAWKVISCNVGWNCVRPQCFTAMMKFVEAS